MFIPQSITVGLIINMLSFLGWGTGLIAIKELKCPPPIFLFDFIIFRFIFSLMFCLILGTSMVDSSTGSWFDDFYPLFQQDPLVILERLGGPIVSGFTDMLFQIFMCIGISSAGLSNSVPLQSGFTTIFGILLTYFVDSRGNLAFLIPGTLFNIIAIVFDALTYKELNKHNEKHIKEYQEELNHSFIANQDSTTISMENIHIDKDMDMKHSNNIANMSTPALILVSVLGAICGTFWGPGTALGSGSPSPLSPYSVIAVVTLTSVLTVFPFGFIYLRKWNKEQPLTFSDYLKTPLKERGPALFCSFLWAIGTWAYAVPTDLIGYATSFAIGQSQSFVTSMWSLLYYKELNHATCKTWVFEVLMLLSYIISIAILFMAFYV